MTTVLPHRFEPPRERKYAAFRLRFRALMLDAFICLGFFFVGGLGVAAAFEHIPAARVVAFILIVLAILAYEPLFVSLYGGTLGHRKLNIRVVDAKSQANLPISKAIVRSIVKQFFGLFSLAFMFVTNRAQGLHDLAVGAEVRIRDAGSAAAADYFIPAQSDPKLPSGLRRVLCIVLYSLLAYCLVSLAAVFSISPECLQLDNCSSSDEMTFRLYGMGWFLLTAVVMSLGWHGRLPGCLKRR